MLRNHAAFNQLPNPNRLYVCLWPNVNDPPLNKLRIPQRNTKLSVVQERNDIHENSQCILRCPNRTLLQVCIKRCNLASLDIVRDACRGHVDLVHVLPRGATLPCQSWQTLTGSLIL